MKIFLTGLIFCFQASFGQGDSAINIPELGCTFKLPSDFKVIDTATLGAESRSLKKTWIKKPVDSNYNKPVFFARDSSRNTVFSIYYVESVHDPLNGEFAEDAYSGIVTLRKTKSTAIYDGVKFNKLQLNGNPRPGQSYVAVMLKTSYQGKIFNITYAYSDSIKGKEIEQMLNTFKFDRQ